MSHRLTFTDKSHRLKPRIVVLADRYEATEFGTIVGSAFDAFASRAQPHAAIPAAESLAGDLLFDIERNNRDHDAAFSEDWTLESVRPCNRPVN